MKFTRNTKRLALGITIFVLFVTGMQFIQPPVQNPPVNTPLAAPGEVVEILQRACYDCHSNQTKLSWYDKVAPVSWLVSADVKEARSRFNFSTWDTLSPADQQGRVWEMVNMVLTKKMPLSTYAAIHPRSKLSEKDIAVLKKYANDLSPANYHDTAIISEADKEFKKFREIPVPTEALPVAANGVKYIPNYQDWQVISTTNRFDNHSIRVVYGNAIAAKAIKDKQISPFPDGSTIVKVVWNSIEEKNGDIKPGSLNSVQIMTKDGKKFPDSKGWGFAKFNGIGLKPYGRTPLFNTTCFNCHKIAGANDYVFNLPLEQPVPGKTPARAMFDAGSLQVITSFANRKQQTMSVLYGNAAAKKSALSAYNTHIPGEVFKLVVYKQADNKYWYGSYINGAVESVETVAGTQSAAAAAPLTYQLDQGTAPRDSAGYKMSAANRMAYIFSHRPSVFP
ncbi:heme-binding domain-containing protein [Chitinophaga sp. GbtcB8]|uniref:heme-binding domain-containing protein n=1 Tax=Chitinophaga sp. GbtcB8 TaxID=2824753 RepID=UPI001C2F7587|nr:heme-binding domain-containing protein [Chitinophaga sp. GbtcB8]